MKVTTSEEAEPAPDPESLERRYRIACGTIKSLTAALLGTRRVADADVALNDAEYGLRQAQMDGTPQDVDEAFRCRDAALQARQEAVKAYRVAQQEQQP